jgi:hypothetical protein
MANPAQKRAVANYRRRLAERGVSRYEVRGLEQDKQLVRKLAGRLAERDAGAMRLRAALTEAIGEGQPSGRQIWEALRRSPLVGADLDLERAIVPPREIDL